MMRRSCVSRCNSPFVVPSDLTVKVAVRRPTDAVQLRRCHHRSVLQHCVASADNVTPAGEGEDGLLPEDDVEVPGNYRDAMSGNTPLGQAVRGACEELDALRALEFETLNQAEALLKSAGFKGSLFAAPDGAPFDLVETPDDEEEEEDDDDE